MKQILVLLLTISQVTFATPSALDEQSASDKVKALPYMTVLPQLKLQMGPDSEKAIAELNKTYQELKDPNASYAEVLKHTLEKGDKTASYWIGIGVALCVWVPVSILSAGMMGGVITEYRENQAKVQASCKAKKSVEILRGLNTPAQTAAASSVNAAR